MVALGIPMPLRVFSTCPLAPEVRQHGIIRDVGHREVDYPTEARIGRRVEWSSGVQDRVLEGGLPLPEPYSVGVVQNARLFH